MAFILVSGSRSERIRRVLQDLPPPWSSLIWVETEAPDENQRCLIGSDALSAVSTPARIGTAPARWQVAFDGYLANTAELAALLPAPPCEQDQNPANLVSHLLGAHGEKVLHRLAGCFALAAVEHTGLKVIGLRDRLGGRTLYRARATDSGLVLATRSAWVQRLIGERFEPDPVFLASHFGLRSGPRPGHSAFAAVQELLPGEMLTRQDGRLSSKRPALELAPDFDYRKPADCVARFLDLFEQAVAATLPSTGDVACMLSGGLDSGPVAVVADRQLSGLDRRLIVTSWRLDSCPEADERAWIEMAGSGLIAQPTLFDGSQLLPFASFDDSQISEELPCYNAFRPLVLGCYQRAAASGCRVILNGSAGDELYPPYHLLDIDRLRRRHLGALWRDLVLLWRIRGWRGLAGDQALRHLLARPLMGLRPARPAPDWLRPQLQEHWRAADWPPEAAAHAYPGYVRQLFGTPMAFGRAHESEFPNRYGVDRRDPFHNEALVRFMLNAPHSLSHHAGRDKWIMRRAMRDLLPDPLRRKVRTGILTPFFHAGLKQHRSRVEQLLFEQAPGWQRYVHPEPIREILAGKREHQSALISQCIGYALWERRWSGG